MSKRDHSPMTKAEKKRRRAAARNPITPATARKIAAMGQTDPTRTPLAQLNRMLAPLLNAVMPPAQSLLFPHEKALAVLPKSLAGKLERITALAHGEEPRRCDKIAALAQEALAELRACNMAEPAPASTVPPPLGQLRCVDCGWRYDPDNREGLWAHREKVHCASTEPERCPVCRGVHAECFTGNGCSNDHGPESFGGSDYP